MMSFKYLINLGLATFLFMGLQHSPAQKGFQNHSGDIMTIPQFKHALKNIDQSGASTQRTFSVTGYFMSERQPLLITNPSLMDANTPVSDSIYLLLRGKGIDSIFGIKGYERARVKLELGIINNKVVVLQRPVVLAVANQ
jgi:hypothetical protein